jgi:hypothetical protein
MSNGSGQKKYKLSLYSSEFTYEQKAFLYAIHTIMIKFFKGNYNDFGFEIICTDKPVSFANLANDSSASAILAANLAKSAATFIAKSADKELANPADLAVDLATNVANNTIMDIKIFPAAANIADNKDIISAAILAASEIAKGPFIDNKNQIISAYILHGIFLKLDI